MALARQMWEERRPPSFGEDPKPHLLPVAAGPKGDTIKAEKVPRDWDLRLGHLQEQQAITGDHVSSP